MRALAVLAVLGCGAAEVAAPPERDDPAAAADLTGYRAVFELRWGGQAIGQAHEHLVRAAGGGYRFERREEWRVRRGPAEVAGGAAVAIETTAALEPVRVEVRGGAAAGTARREGDRWRIAVAGEAPRTGRGMPIEILPILLARRGQARWSGPVLLSGLGFAPAHAVVEPDGEAGRLVQISGPAGILTTRIALRPDGTVARAVGPDLSAHRAVSSSALAAPRPPDLLAAGSLEVAGEPSGAIEIEADGGRRVTLVPELPPVAPPAVPDPPPSPAVRQRALRLARGAASPADEIAQLARGTARLLAGEPDADCVRHAALFSALARARGHAVQLVIGYRLDGRRLVRHAWAAVDIGGRLHAVDPTSGGPAGPGHLPLAVHGSAAAEVALASELAYAGLTGARARFIAPRSARSTPRTP
ncbi:MAG TPA: transglutaminase family protein [Kofleriaceae bacterium]|nr:transglutaminase family protein [Kofleriaceae bacterium]